MSYNQSKFFPPFVKHLRPMPVALSLMIFASSSARADYATIVDPTTEFQTFQGWGTSLAWWANVVGGYPEPARNDYMEKAFDPIKGLGLNVVRYNIGGGENPQHLAPNKQFLQYRAAVPGFQPSPGLWDWTADANQRWVLQQAIQKGANQLEAFSNSPPYWMTKSGSVTGNVNRTDNLKPEADSLFADYLAEVVKRYRDDWHINFRFLTPLNEPTNWWTLGYWQEGCVVDRPHQNTLIKKTGEALSRRNLRTTVTASDETSIQAANETTRFYDSEALKHIAKINAHSYGGGDRTRLANFANSNGKDLWLSEYGDKDETGLTMSRRILEDMHGLHPTTWAYWQVVDSSSGWGFLRNPLKDQVTTQYTINKKYYVMGNYSRFIRPGFKLLAIGDRNSLAAYHAPSQTLVIVTTNSSDTDAQTIYDLSRFTRIGPAAQPSRTSPTEDLARLPSIAITNKRFSVNTPACSVTTYVITGAIYKGKRSLSYRNYYQLVNQESKLVVGADSAGALVQAPNKGDYDQQWGLVNVGDDLYKIVNRKSGLALDVSKASKESGARVLPYSYVDGAHQQWKLQWSRNKVCKVISRNSGLILSPSSPLVGAGLVQQADNGGNSQQWRLLMAKP